MRNGLRRTLDRFLNRREDDGYYIEDETDNYSFMQGKRMLFRCYWTKVRTSEGDKDALVDSHDNLIVVPDQNSSMFDQDVETMISAVRMGRERMCVARNGARRIEVVGNVRGVEDNYLILSDIEYTYKEAPLSDVDLNTKGTVVFDANRLHNRR